MGGVPLNVERWPPGRQNSTVRNISILVGRNRWGDDHEQSYFSGVTGGRFRPQKTGRCFALTCREHARQMTTEAITAEVTAPGRRETPGPETDRLHKFHTSPNTLQFRHPHLRILRLISQMRQSSTVREFSSGNAFIKKKEPGSMSYIAGFLGMPAPRRRQQATMSITAAPG